MPIRSRVYVCGFCQLTVEICSDCDRGQRYCGKTCASAARRLRRREAARRYQDTPRGRMAHALRARRYRERRRSDIELQKNVTHQTSPITDSDDLLRSPHLDAVTVAEYAASNPGVRRLPRCCRCGCVPTMLAQTDAARRDSEVA